MLLKVMRRVKKVPQHASLSLDIPLLNKLYHALHFHA